VWNVHKAIVGNETPVVLDAEHQSNVFSLTFDCSQQRIISAGNDDHVIVHDIQT
jgi:WD40 repeat protein